MWSYIYKKLVIDFSKLTLFTIIGVIVFSIYQAKNFNLDASSDALLLEGDKDLKYLREINERYGSKDFLVLLTHRFQVLLKMRLFLIYNCLNLKLKNLLGLTVLSR